jgi:hypothetical protein
MMTELGPGRTKRGANMNATIRIVVLAIVAAVAVTIGLWLPHFNSNIVAYVGLAIAGVGAIIGFAVPWERAVLAAARSFAKSRRTLAYSLIVFGLIIGVSGISLYESVNDRADRTQMDVIALTQAVKTYKLKYGTTPRTLDDVLQFIEGGSPSNLLDQWDRRFDFDPNGPRNGGKQPDIWTVSPGGELIGNWRRP